MGVLLAKYKTSYVNDIINGITSNTNNYYAFASNPVLNSGNVVPINTSDDFDTQFITIYQLLFGKRLANTDITAVITNNLWVSGNIYTRYDNMSDTLYSNNNYYVVVEPGILGADFIIYLCIDNNSNSPSINQPSLIQPTTFQTADGYLWRYITSISSVDYETFGTTQFLPIYPNTTIVTSALSYSGVDVVSIINAGNGYACYTNGTIQGVVNTTLVQIQSTANTSSGFYVNNSIYFYNSSSATAQLRNIVGYVSNTVGSIISNWVYLDTPANTQNIISGQTQYIISPKVVFNTDGISQPAAYTTINPSSNSINSVIIIDPGAGISRANVYIQSNTFYPSIGSNNIANVYAIVPPLGGHGSDPLSEFNIKGVSFAFKFSNSQTNTIPTTVTYNKIGLIKNPYSLITTSNSSATILTQGALYPNATFNQLLSANLNPTGVSFTVGDTVIGTISNAIGTVAYSNNTQIFLTGDKNFVQGEPIISSNGDSTSNININSFGNIHSQSADILYVQNLSDVVRSNTDTEHYRLIIAI